MPRMRLPLRLALILGLLLTPRLLPAAFAAEEASLPRLSHDAIPTSEQVQLTLDPEKTTYTGSATIPLSVKKSTRELRFHARALTVDVATLHGAAGAVAVTKIEKLAPDQVRLDLASALTPGDYTLTLHFHNAYNTRAVALYRVVTGGHSYLFTQLEDTEAREAFPCWDEPEFKIPWQLTLTVPAADLAVSNTPIASETRAGTMKRVVFARTRPLPSYLIAIAAGPLETVPIPGMHMPGRVVTVRGAGALAAEAVKVTPGIIHSLETYFGRPYPYEKLDLIAAPEFLYGAMENAGAIVFADRRLLIDPRAASPEQVQSLTSVIAHECAHMWFGDLVTMKWWDDLWLNESFASWMATKVMDDVAADNHNGITTIFGEERAFATDSRPSTRAMRGPIVGTTSLGQTANELTYNKGEAVLTMFEGWLGRETFRRGVVQYLNDHEWRNAEGSDLWLALGKVSGDDVVHAMSSFLDQAGVPRVVVEPIGGGQVRLSQHRFFSSIGAPRDTSLWRIPVTMRYPAGGEVKSLRVWLTRADTVVDLGVAKFPTWVEPNSNGTGYYRWNLPDAALDSLVANAAKLTPRERIDLIANLTAGLRAGNMRGDRYLEAMATLADDSSPEVLRATAEALNQTHAALVSARATSAFGSYVRVSFAPAMARIQLRPQPKEEVAVSLARPTLLRLLAGDGRDAQVMAYAESLGRAYRKDPSSIPASLTDFALLQGAAGGNRALFDEYRSRFESTTIPNERVLYLAGLGSFHDPALRQSALDYALHGPLRPQETLVIPGAMSSNPSEAESRGSSSDYPDEIANWTMEHFSELAAKMPPNFTQRILGLTSGCSEERSQKLRAFIADPAHNALGSGPASRRLLDAMEECTSLHQRESERVERFLFSQAAAP